MLVTTNHECRISYPFYHLKSEKFWTLIPKSGFDDVNALGSLVKSFSNLNAAIECAVLQEELFALMIDPKFNQFLTQFLLDTYFPETKSNFFQEATGQLKIFSEIESKILNEPSEAYRIELKQLIEQKNEEEIFLRGSLFKREIPKIYDNTCCISGMKISSTVNVSMIDACHIVPFSVSYDDTITNGIALCPNLHRAFDRGLIAIDADYKVIVSEVFIEDETSYGIRVFEGKKINLPKQTGYYPLKENFEWHLNHTFKG